MIVGDREYRFYLASLDPQEASFIRKFFDSFRKYIARSLVVFPSEVELQVEFEAVNFLKVKWPGGNRIGSHDLEGIQSPECWSTAQAMAYKGDLWLEIHLSAECALCDREGCELCLDDEALRDKQGELM